MRHDGMLYQHAFIKASLRAVSFSLNVAENFWFGSKHIFSPSICLNDTTILKKMLNEEFHFSFSKHVDKSLGVKSLKKLKKAKRTCYTKFILFTR